MDTKVVAKDSYHLATRLEECPFDHFWVVLLDDGTEVYQNEDNLSFKEHNPWMRLKQLCEECGRKICHMAYASRDGVGQINCVPDANGYFFSKRLRQLMSMFSSYADDAVGVGYLRGNILTIHWKRNDGVIETEERDITKLPNIPFNLIRS